MIQELDASTRELEYELEQELEGNRESEMEGEWESVQPEGFWPEVLRVVASGARGAAPLLRVVGRRLGPAAARTAARQAPGVFARGTSRQVRSFALRVGGQLVGPERHGAGLPHYHLIRPDGDRIHIWFGRQTPRSDFFE